MKRLELTPGCEVICYREDTPDVALWSATVVVVSRKITVVKRDGSRRHFNLRGEFIDPCGAPAPLRIRRAS